MNGWRCWSDVDLNEMLLIGFYAVLPKTSFHLSRSNCCQYFSGLRLPVFSASALNGFCKLPADPVWVEGIQRGNILCSCTNDSPFSFLRNQCSFKSICMSKKSSVCSVQPTRPTPRYLVFWPITQREGATHHVWVGNKSTGFSYLLFQESGAQSS